MTEQEAKQTPVVINDPVLGKFEFDKTLKQFYGEIDWLGKKISALFYVDPDDRATWTDAMNILKKLSAEQVQRDAEFRAFAADKLTKLANDWAQEGVAPIAPQDFIKRISLVELAVHDPAGNFFSASYDADDLFTDHGIIVGGSIKEGLQFADIEG